MTAIFPNCPRGSVVRSPWSVVACSAFTLIELLVVISIIAVLAAIAVPTISNFRKADATVSGTRQLLDDVARARQLAIANRTTVYMVFCPSNFWNDALRTGGANNFTRLTQAERDQAAKLYDKQLTGYNFVSLRSVGDQPGRSYPRYHSAWRVMPDGTFIADWKFRPYLPPPAYVRVITDPTDNTRQFAVNGFPITNTIPFPSEDAAVILPPYVTLPFIAFNHLGQLTVDGINLADEDEYIPVARGSVIYQRNAGKTALQANPTVIESPPGNSINAYTLVHIDRLTGRARLQRQEFQ